MGRFVSLRWSPDPTAMGPRSARAGGTYRAFIPDPLTNVPLVLQGSVAADLADAERAMVVLDASIPQDRGPHRLEVLARLLLRAEAVGSSQVEGLVVSPRKLAMAALDPALDPSGRALEVVGNIRAMEEALTLAESAESVGIADLCAIHRRLFDGTRDAHLGGRLRSEQNWIGGHGPVDAAFVPPPPAEVIPLLEDLCVYASGDAHPPLVQAALAHAWFETIHPFGDGNGRTGRALLHLILRRRGLCRRFVPPISLVLATRSRQYVAGLTGTRVIGDAADPRLAEGVNIWLELVASAARVACEQAHTYEAKIAALLERWRARVVEVYGALRADAAVWTLLSVLPAAPLLTASAAGELTGRSARAVDGAIAQLVAAGVLRQVGGRIRYRVYEAAGVFDLVTDAERALASPGTDTRRSPPVRAVPGRRPS